MQVIAVILMFLFVFVVGYLATGGADKFIRKNCSPFKDELDLGEPDYEDVKKKQTRLHEKKIS
ncbi:hypothetical protein LQE92_11705 [Lacrimispora sp. NSJ-141]|uniref:Uncharacterized protein n=1 Tax=Lientehia hominis TaxID=2897778 RepID=A0AAP2RKE6_9FIRM|nr:hypothetical protein [Lientehia hominis]MCD2493280.1 hypothetical protein [Lientehia hominis]